MIFRNNYLASSIVKVWVKNESVKSIQKEYLNKCPLFIFIHLLLCYRSITTLIDPLILINL